MRLQHIRTLWVAIAAVILVAVALGPAIPYWVAIGAHPARCIYGDPVCSLTVSTYLLGMLTLGAFLAAYKAARYTQEALEHEKLPALSVQSCNASHKRPPLRLFISDVTKGFVMEPPADINASPYQPAEVELISVGRSPVVNGILTVTACNPQGQEFSLPVDIGSIRAGKSEHLALLFSQQLANVTFRWNDRATHMKGFGISFHARQSIIERSAVAKIEPPPAFLPSNAPQKKPPPGTG